MVGVYPSKAPLRFSTLGYAPGLTHKHYTRLARLARDKHYLIKIIRIMTVKVL